MVVRPAQLTADLADFTGRAGQVKALSELLSGAGQRPGVVPVGVLTGPGGVGKTSLAVHVAHLVRDRFPDGQLVVRLGGAGPNPAEPGQVLSRFLRDLGIDSATEPAGEAERSAQFRSMLAGRRVLILLDDARDNAQVAPLIPGTSGCAVIVTSRNPLSDVPGARQVPLTALTGDQALKLLSRIIGASRMRAGEQAAAAVTELCAGLPLALRIAGSRLAARPHWRIEDLAGRLANATARLDELAIGDLSVRASFDVSYGNLPHKDAAVPPARAFRLLSLWAGPDTGVPGAAALFGSTVPAAEQALPLPRPARRVCRRARPRGGISGRDRRRHQAAAGLVPAQRGRRGPGHGAGCPYRSAGGVSGGRSAVRPGRFRRCRRVAEGRTAESACRGADDRRAQ
jgi:hypothetical protein